MVDEQKRNRLPPYVSYRTFRNFVDGLQQAMPARIDRSYWGDMLSGSTGIQLMAALRFLGLIDANGRPTSRLGPLVTATGEKKAALLREISAEAFDFVLRGSFDPQTATYAQLQELFHSQFQLTGDVSRKCLKFFIALATDAGMPLSRFITKRTRSLPSGTATKTLTKKSSVRTNRNLLVPQRPAEIPDGFSWYGMLLEKFPTFDPAWPDEVKLKWFDAFDQLLKRGMPEAIR